MSQAHPLVFLVLIAVVAGIGAYFGSYLKQKGKNLATHEDIGKLVDQVAAVTKTAKEIEAKISSEVWDRQKRWELRKEVLFEAAKRIVEADDALASIRALLSVRQENPSDDFTDETHTRLNRWNRSADMLNLSCVFVSIVCTQETYAALSAFQKDTANIAKEMATQREAPSEDVSAELSRKFVVAIYAIRKELEIGKL